MTDPRQHFEKSSPRSHDQGQKRVWSAGSEKEAKVGCEGRLLLLRVVFLPEFRHCPVRNQGRQILGETDKFELWKVAEELEVLRLRRKSELQKGSAALEGREVNNVGKLRVPAFAMSPSSITACGWSRFIPMVRWIDYSRMWNPVR